MYWLSPLIALDDGGDVSFEARMPKRSVSVKFTNHKGPTGDFPGRVIRASVNYIVIHIFSTYGVQ